MHMTMKISVNTTHTPLPHLRALKLILMHFEIVQKRLFFSECPYTENVPGRQVQNRFQVIALLLMKQRKPLHYLHSDK